MEPGRIFTRDELKEQFNFSGEEVDRFLDLMEDFNASSFKVIHVMDERMLVFEDKYWELALRVMESMGRTRGYNV